jgi:hypothetical protein
MHELYTKISATPFESFGTRLVAIAPNAVNCPVEEIAGPEVVVSPMPKFAASPLYATLTISGSPVPEVPGSMVNPTAFETPPPGAGFDTCTGSVPALAIIAVSSVTVASLLAITVVVCGIPLKITTEAGLNPVPNTDIATSLVPPAPVVVGANEVIVGTAFATVNGSVFEAPPPGGGFSTAICRIPAVIRSFEVSVPESSVPFTSEVLRLLLFTVTTDVELNPVPVTKRSTWPEPAIAVLGESDVIVGVWLLLEFTVKFTVPEVPPPGDGVNTDMTIVPGSWMSVGMTIVLSSVSLRKMVFPDRGMLLNSTTDCGANPLPVSVITNPGLPATALVGETDFKFGDGLFTVSAQDCENKNAVNTVSAGSR